MKRRQALQTLSASLGAMLVVPEWANGWSRQSLGTLPNAFTADQTALLTGVVDTFIPETDTPGAKSLGVATFVQKMVADCYEPKAQTTLSNGLNAADALARQTYNRPFTEADTAQRIDVLKRMEQSTDADQKAFYQLVKGLTIRGYMTSEYVMTNLTHYEMIPGRYHGCVPVPAKPISQTK
ncbi:hypothetical protein FAES_1408 [Fibrella aestuarina BUZ 2]|uniref:Twin-arginine translocation pathway signal n=1 Tax=Fibrella aestuarina BUZ 2 TaxID=1166018 RepID=I0K5L5_9BACT|nr:gluconate 2-dehydrogenase subunit 3 family protein [Fibrella aestuarina]CCG99418.1 hypothetical protein FAES_1408 [Fibrella aestuarina BUZ 2]